MTNLSVNVKARKIEMSKTFAKNAYVYGTEEYNALQAVRRDYPDYQVKVKKSSAKQTDNHKGLTYEYMEAYIQKHDDEDGSKMEMFKMLRGTSEDAQAACAGSASYDDIKNWFFSEFPEIENFYKAREIALKQAREYAERKAAEKAAA